VALFIDDMLLCDGGGNFRKPRATNSQLVLINYKTFLRCVVSCKRDAGQR